MSQSTVIIGLGQLGHDVLERVSQMLTERDSVRFLSCPVDEIADRLLGSGKKSASKNGTSKAVAACEKKSSRRKGAEATA